MPIIRHKGWEISENEVTPEKLFKNRRQVIKGMGLSVAGLTAMASGAVSAIPQEASVPHTQNPAFRQLEDEQTPYAAVTSYNNYYEFGTDKGDPAQYADSLTTEPWSVRVEGHVRNPGVYNVEDLIDFNTLEERIYRMRCVEAWSMVIPWLGVPLSSLVEKLQPTSSAQYIQFETAARPGEMRGLRYPVLDWPYVEGLHMDEAMNPLTMMAVGLYGKTLLPQNGAPMRLVVPWKYGFKGIKSIVAIRFVEEQPVTSWNQSWPEAYGFYANVNPNVSHPRWNQDTERRIGEFRRRDTLMFNGYGEWVADMYRGMDLARYY